MGEIEYAYAGHITKYEKQPDGTLMVYGVASDPAEDLDGQGCDPEWLKKAMPDWFKYGNVREQHSSIAAGKGKELTHGAGDQWFLKSHVVDPGTVTKVINGVLTGYSVGIRDGRVRKDKAAGYPNGRIVDGKIVEISLVDRPCNPNATITIVKAAPSGVLEPVAVPELPAGDVLAVDLDPTMLAADQDGTELSDGPDNSADDDPLGLFDLEFGDDDADDEQDDDADEYADVVDKALALIEVDADDDEPVTITKGLLESLIHGPGEAKRGPGGKFAGRKKTGASEAEKRRKERERREAEAERERKHRGKMDAEALQDAENASRQGRRQESGEHRARLGSYSKAAAVGDGWDVLAALPDELIAKAVRAAAAGEVLAAEELLEPTIRKAAGVSLDDSSADGATLMSVTEIEERFAEVTKAHKAELDSLRAQVDAMMAMPIPGGPMINKSVATSAPAQPAIHPALTPSYWEQLAAQPGLNPEVRGGYLAKAEEIRRRG